jgi:hypothetical protein
MSTRIFGQRLETQPTKSFREQIVVRHAPLSERMAESEQRMRFVALWADAEKRPAFTYEYTREERKKAIADDRQRVLIQAGLADGSITVERYMDYRLWQIETDLAHVPSKPTLDDVSFVRFTTEAAEGIEACVEARCEPSPEKVDRAIAEMQEMVAATQLRAATIAKGKG